MSTEATQGSPETSTTVNPETPQNGLGTPAPAAPDAPTPPAASPLEFIPEEFRSASWATKYQNPQDFFKGVDNMAKMVGQKQIVQGIQPPGEGATDEDWSKFFGSIGRPESADKYELPADIQVPEGYNIDQVKQNFTALAHKNGLTQKQASTLFKDFIELEKQNFSQSQERVKADFDKALLDAFGEDYQSNLALAKKGAKALGVADKLDAEGLSANPTVLKLVAKLGEFVGEDTFIEGNSSASKESLLEEAQRLQRSALYQNGDPATTRRVEEIYKTVYPPKKG